MALHAALAYTAHITPSLPPTSLVTKAVRLHLHAAHHPPNYPQIPGDPALRILLHFTARPALHTEQSIKHTNQHTA